MPADLAASGPDYSRRTDELLAGLAGDVLEIGAGTGANFHAFGSRVRWTGLEPDRRSRERLRETARAHGHNGAILDAPAERIPLPDASVDAVVSTVALCSVADQDATLAEVVRVLRPGGRLVFCEHVAAPAGTWSRRVQRLMAPLSQRFDRGCDPSRETWLALQRAAFDRVDIEWFAGHRPLGVRIPFIAGSAWV